MRGVRRFLELLVLTAIISNSALAGTIKKKDGKSVSGEIKGTLVFRGLIHTGEGGGGCGLTYCMVSGKEGESITEEGVRRNRPPQSGKRRKS